MKTILIIIGTLVLIFSVLAMIGSKTTTNPKGLQTALDNKKNKQAYPIGAASDFEKSISKYKKLSKEELTKIIEEKSLNLYEISNLLMILGNIYLQKSDLETGLPLMEAAAYDYHNPLAMVVLARANFHGYEEESEGTVPVKTRDLEKAFYLINRAIETAGHIEKKTAEKYALNRTVAGGLGLLDSYNLPKVKKEFNQQEHSKRISEIVLQDVSNFKRMYGL